MRNDKIIKKANETEKKALALSAKLLNLKHSISENEYERWDGLLGVIPSECKERNSKYKQLILNEGFLLEKEKIEACLIPQNIMYALNILDGIIYLYQIGNNSPYKTNKHWCQISEWNKEKVLKDVVFLPVEDAVLRIDMKTEKILRKNKGINRMNGEQE